MNFRIIATLGAALLLTLGGVSADARSLGGGGHFGGGGGNFGGGAHFSGGGGHFGGHMGGGNFAARSFRGSPSFGAQSFHGQSFHGQSFRGSRIARVPHGDRVFRPGRNYANVYGNHWHGGRHGRHHHRHGYPIIIGGGYYDDYYYDDGDYGDDCGWLYRRAVQTGSPYWWRRYRACEY